MKTIILLVLFIPLLSNQKVFPETRFYSGLSLTYFSVSGSDFDGNTYLMEFYHHTFFYRALLPLTNPNIDTIKNYISEGR